MVTLLHCQQTLTPHDPNKRMFGREVKGEEPLSIRIHSKLSRCGSGVTRT